MKRKREELTSSSKEELPKILKKEINQTVNTAIAIEKASNFFICFPGRRSFGGFNKSVENYYQLALGELRHNKYNQKSTKNQVSDEEMVMRYENLIGLPRGPNQSRKLGNLKYNRELNLKQKCELII
jgi:hypothetical protein